jgi:hypothetical protein
MVFSSPTFQVLDLEGGGRIEAPTTQYLAYFRRSLDMKVQLIYLLLITLVVGLSACGGARLASGKQHNSSCASNF